jgi:hypothetical protein
MINLVRIAGFRTEIWNRDLPNTKYTIANYLPMAFCRVGSYMIKEYF